jgi:hypothetical protein
MKLIRITENNFIRFKNKKKSFQEYINYNYQFKNMETFKPNLVEPGVKYFLRETLKQTHLFRLKYYNSLFNIGLLVFFISLLGFILLMKYKMNEY